MKERTFFNGRLIVTVGDITAMKVDARAFLGAVESGRA